MAKSSKSLLGVGLLSAVAASLCCITPVLAMLAGVTGVAATFSWLEPFRPYLIGVTVFSLGFAWYKKLKPRKEADCDCEVYEKPKFIQTKTFLGIVTVFAFLMLAFPYYSSIFFPKEKDQVIFIDQSNIDKVKFEITGMTCSGCAEHVKIEVDKLNGIIYTNVSYEKENAIIEFDKSKINIAGIERAINSTGYKVIRIKEN